MEDKADNFVDLIYATDTVKLPVYYMKNAFTWLERLDRSVHDLLGCEMKEMIGVLSHDSAL